MPEFWTAKLRHVAGNLRLKGFNAKTMAYLTQISGHEHAFSVTNIYINYPSDYIEILYLLGHHKSSSDILNT